MAKKREEKLEQSLKSFERIIILAKKIQALEERVEALEKGYVKRS